MNNPRSILTVSLCAALLIITGSYILLTGAGDGRITIPEPDQLIYMQYARNMATGQPYVFLPDDAPSSGSTTHLYIMVLAVLHRLGATGDAFLTASFVLNSLFYLGILIMVWLIAKRMIPRALLLVMLLTVLSGHTASAVLKQTDIGFFTLLALSTFAALLYQRHFTALILAALCAASRPEGFIFAVSFGACGVAGLWLNRKSPAGIASSRQAMYFLLFSIVGILVFLLTLLINYKTTGYFQFMSVANKGYFKVYPFSGALLHTLQDALSLIKGVFFGLHESHRQFYFFPALTGILGIGGIMLYHRENRQMRMCECWFGLAACAALLLVASSQYQGISNDRYLGWMIPIWIVYIAIGWVEISDRIKAPHFAAICAGILLIYQGTSLAYMAGTSYTHAISMEYQRGLGDRIDQTFDPSIRFGSMAGGGINYFMPQHNAYNVRGINSPDFFTPRDGMYLHRIIDLLKHRPELRFDYWISTEAIHGQEPWITPLIGDLVMQDMNTALTSKGALGVYIADWKTLNGGNDPILVKDMIEGLALIDRLDVGHMPDEESHHHSWKLRLKNTILEPIARTDQLGDFEYSEAGRIILGSESFNVFNVQTNQPLVIVLRTGKAANGNVIFGPQYSKINKFELNDAIDLRLFVDHEEVPCPQLDIGIPGFNEVVIQIPAQYVKSDSPRIQVVGDHISYAYWFYQ